MKQDRGCFTAAGKPKRRYATRADAKRSARTHPEDGVAPYRCPTCDWFHVGHYPANPITRSQLRARHRKETSE